MWGRCSVPLKNKRNINNKWVSDLCSYVQGNWYHFCRLREVSNFLLQRGSECNARIGCGSSLSLIAAHHWFWSCNSNWMNERTNERTNEGRKDRKEGSTKEWPTDWLTDRPLDWLSGWMKDWLVTLVVATCNTRRKKCCYDRWVPDAGHALHPLGEYEYCFLHPTPGDPAETG